MTAAEMSVFIASPCRLKKEPIAHGADDAVVGAMGSSTAGMAQVAVFVACLKPTSP
jgi:hypothetical protein